jgi:serine/threonine protein kinase
MIETGTVLQQRYKIDKQIGQGGMGAVYIATDNRFASTVAIKETLCMDDNFRKAIEREARLLNSLRHSALPKVSDHFEENNGMFIVMEYIQGDDLAAMLEDTSVRFPVDRVLAWADQLLDALDYLHNQVIPVIHRDIKPQNLKINSRGEIVLLDFGLAKGNPTDAGTNHTAAKSIFGYSRNYAALEQIQGTGTDPRSDLYSLAATLYHLLTRRAPDDALTRAMSVLSAKPDPLVPANILNPEVPAGVAGVLAKAMDLNASERPGSAAEMRQMLREHEKYSDYADAPTVTAHIDPRVFAQKTQLMPEGTRPMFSDPNARTEVLPMYASQATSVRSPDTAGQNGATVVHAEPPKRRGMTAGLGAAGLLAVAALAGGIYMVQPGAADTPQKQQQVTTSEPATTRQEAPLAQAVAENEADKGAASQGTADAGDAATQSAPIETAPRAADPGKGQETAKTTIQPKASGRGKTMRIEDGDDSINIDLDNNDNPTGDIVMTGRDENGRIKTMRFNQPPPPKHMQKNPGGGARTEEFVFREPSGFENMPPAARRKLMETLRNLPKYNRARPIPIPPKQPANNEPGL